jgi:hypothetical protein
MLIQKANSWGLTVDNFGTTASNLTAYVRGAGAAGAESVFSKIIAGSAVTADCYRIWLLIHSGSTSAADTSRLCDFRIVKNDSGDTATATDAGNAPVFVENLIAGAASASHILGYNYWFPLFIPKGSSLWVRQQTPSTTAVYVAARLFGKPSRPDSLWAGSAVETVGTINAGAQGVALTADTHIVNGAITGATWASLGTSAKACQHWTLGVQLSSAAFDGRLAMFDLSYGDGSSNRLIRDRAVFGFNDTAERAGMQPEPDSGWMYVPAGSTLYTRGSLNGTVQSGYNALAYGVY